MYSIFEELYPVTLKYYVINLPTASHTFDNSWLRREGALEREKVRRERNEGKEG